MIEETLNLLGKIDLVEPGDAITMLDGDALEINIIRDGQRNTILNLSHFNASEEGERIPVDPLRLLVTIERAGQGREARKRPGKLNERAERKPRAKVAKRRRLDS